jgi:hypothetical protein
LEAHHQLGMILNLLTQELYSMLLDSNVFVHTVDNVMSGKSYRNCAEEM